MKHDFVVGDLVRVTNVEGITTKPTTMQDNYAILRIFIGSIGEIVFFDKEAEEYGDPCYRVKFTNCIKKFSLPNASYSEDFAPSELEYCSPRSPIWEV